MLRYLVNSTLCAYFTTPNFLSEILTNKTHKPYTYRWQKLRNMNFENKITFITLFAILLISCREQPTFCDRIHEVEEIKLVPTRHWTEGKEVVVKNDSLIDFITSQICQIKDVQWSTGTRGEGERVEIQLIPSKSKKSIFVVHRDHLEDNDYRFREGSIYFKNDLLCKTVFELTRIPMNQ